MAAINIKTCSKVIPQCYAYITPGVIRHEGWTKIGSTERDVETRIKEQTHTVGVEYETCWAMRAVYMTEPYGTFTDRNFHAYLSRLGVRREPDTEWFEINPDSAKMDFIDFTLNHGEIADTDADATIPYKLRTEQEEAVTKTLEYFAANKHGEFLWNAKPRFGKTLAAYDLCMRLHATNILIVTNRPAIANSWYSDYETFFGPKSGYLFVSTVDALKGKKNVLTREEYTAKLRNNKDEDNKGCIEFVSLQNLKDALYFGGTRDKLIELSRDPKKGVNWDILIVDEAHEGVDTYRTDTAFNEINRKYTLHLSGTPFKALASDKFPADAIFNWTYADEQESKRNWDKASEIENPYENLPGLSLYTYKMSDIVRDKLRKGIELTEGDSEEFSFNLNEFFRTDDEGKFIHKDEVHKFIDTLATGEKFPFSTPELRNELKHTFWLLNRVSAARALAKELKLHPVFKDYEIVLAAGDGKIDDDDENEKSFNKVQNAIATHDKTITLSVGQLTTGVTIPEWTAVLMLCDMESPALYMQAAFRAQNPCLFTDNNGDTYRKENAYIFDFDPARTLKIYEHFANDLSPRGLDEGAYLDTRRENVHRLLNFFSVYGEDEGGAMIELDAEKVLSLPRHIYAKEVVERGFMSNFLFANIGGIFSAPKEIIDMINNMQAIEEPKTLPPSGIDESTAGSLYLNNDNEVDVPESVVIGTAKDLFGHGVYEKTEDELVRVVEDIKHSDESMLPPSSRDRNIIREKIAEPITKTLLDAAGANYGADIKKSTELKLEQKIREETDKVINKEYGTYTITYNKLKSEHTEAIKKAQESDLSYDEITKINEKYENKYEENHRDLLDTVKKKFIDEGVLDKVTDELTRIVVTTKATEEKSSIEKNVRDHLRGLARTIPSFLMAYGDENTTLGNFDKLVPNEVFWKVTVNPQNGEGVTLDEFRLLRDGGDYIGEDGKTKHFDGHLFDEVVFNDAVKEFMKKRAELADYFEEEAGDIFDYIPPQRTNQIFTPRAVVKDMVDRLEKENPGCFDDPNASFADLYMKSGMYVTEIVKRLYNSKRLKALYPDSAERLNHIFGSQVYGCAPDEIIYRICLRYILGFSNEIHIEKNNIRLCDTLEYAKKGTLEEKLREIFDL